MKKIIYMLIAPLLLISCLAFANLTSNQVKHPFYKPEFKNKPADTVKYRQKIKRTAARKQEEEKAKADYEAYKQTDDFKQKMSDINIVMGKTLSYKVIEYKNIETSRFIKEGFIVSNNGRSFLLQTAYGQPKQLKKLLKIGDEVEIKVSSGGIWGEDIPTLIEPLIVTRGNEEIYCAVEANPIPKQPFLFEANRVRFTDGQVTNIKKYPNGKWKSAIVEVVNGYKIKFNIKPSAPDFNSIEYGDHVTFRFVHEVKTGTKEYTVNDWVSLSTDMKDYGIKNPDYFYKFYEKL